MRELTAGLILGLVSGILVSSFVSAGLFAFAITLTVIVGSFILRGIVSDLDRQKTEALYDK